MKLEQAVNIADLRRMAKRRLPPPVFDLIDGAAGDETTMNRNEQAFRDIAFRPRPFVDVSERDLSTDVFGERISFPVMLAPTGAGRVAHKEAELAVAAAAASADTIYMQSTVTTFRPEDVAQASSRPLWYQLYLPHSRDETSALLDRVKSIGYSALAVTIDTAAFGNRERDAHNRLAIPARITPRLVAQGISRPSWSWDFLRGNLSITRAKRGQPQRLTVTATQNQILATQWPVTLEDLKFVRDTWNGPLLVKGLMRADEVDELAGLGLDGVIVSNHGGRQLDGVPATIDVLPSVVEAAAGRMEIYLDGGIRRGVDVVKAIALGAKAVFIGRPYLYGLAAGGEQGVSAALRMLHNEVDLTMALLGCRAVCDIDRSVVSAPRPRSPDVPQ
jgi:isopentenyl diphosphate isomerase/L-lactate dehydrogenase-like FMN-dependent dehydrogenase